MKLQGLYYFTKIADEGSYTKAAKACYVTQPALSRAIQELEEELGCQLIKRKGRYIQLTESGKMCYKQAKIILKNCDDMKKMMDQTHLQQQKVRIGYLILGHLIYFQKQYQLKTFDSSIQIEAVYGLSYVLKEKLIHDQLDLILLPTLCAQKMNHAQVRVLSKDQLCILVELDHPLAKYETLKFKDLKEEKIISWDSEDLPIISKAYIEAFHEHGIAPNIVATAKKLGDLFILLSQYKAAALISPVTLTMTLHDFKLIPIEDSHFNYGLSLCWKKENSNVALQQFIQKL